jgi:hypothetical protein
VVEVLVGLIIELRSREGGRGYCAKLHRDGEWGFVAEILAFTRVLGCPIMIYRRGAGCGPPVPLDSYGPADAGPHVPIIRYLRPYVNGSHYMALRAAGCAGLARAKSVAEASMPSRPPK